LSPLAFVLPILQRDGYKTSPSLPRRGVPDLLLWWKPNGGYEYTVTGDTPLESQHWYKYTREFWPLAQVNLLARQVQRLFPLSCANRQEFKAPKCIATTTTCGWSTSKRRWFWLKPRLNPLGCWQATTAWDQPAWPILTRLARRAWPAAWHDSPLWSASISRWRTGPFWIGML
jgi:hypothetical protein